MWLWRLRNRDPCVLMGQLQPKSEAKGRRRMMFQLEDSMTHREKNTFSLRLFILLSLLTDGMKLPYIESSYWFKCVFHPETLSQKHPYIMFTIWAPQIPVKLTHKINDYCDWDSIPGHGVAKKKKKKKKNTTPSQHIKSGGSLYLFVP